MVFNNHLLPIPTIFAITKTQFVPIKAYLRVRHVYRQHLLLLPLPTRRMFQLIFLQHFTNHSLTKPKPIQNPHPRHQLPPTGTTFSTTIYHHNPLPLLLPTATADYYCQLLLPTATANYLPATSLRLIPYYLCLLLPLPTAYCHCLLPHSSPLTPHAFYCPLPTGDCPLPTSSRLTPYAFSPTLTPFLVIRTQSPVSYKSIHLLIFKNLKLCQKLVTTL
jgi:hypothetical protein